MHTHKAILILLISLFCTINAFAQDEKPKSEFLSFKNQIEVDVKNIFKSYSGYGSILYKRNIGTNEEQNTIKLLRLSGQINNSFVLSEPPTRNPADTNYIQNYPLDNVSFSLALGFERQKITNKFVHYLGVDAIFSYSKVESDYSRLFGGIVFNSFRSTGRITEIYRMGINPLFGVKYYFTKRLNLGIETGFNITYFDQSIQEYGFVYELLESGGLRGVFQENEPYKINGFQTSFNNLRFLTLGFIF